MFSGWRLLYMRTARCVTGATYPSSRGRGLSRPASVRSRMSIFGIPNPRNVGLLALAQGFFMSVQSMAIATTPLAGYALLGVDKTLSTLPVSLVHFAIMLTTVPASLLMGRIGRRGGFTV